MLSYDLVLISTVGIIVGIIGAIANTITLYFFLSKHIPDTASKLAVLLNVTDVLLCVMSVTYYVVLIRYEVSSSGERDNATAHLEIGTRTLRIVDSAVSVLTGVLTLFLVLVQYLIQRYYGYAGSTALLSVAATITFIIIAGISLLPEILSPAPHQMLMFVITNVIVSLIILVTCFLLQRNIKVTEAGTPRAQSQ